MTYAPNDSGSSVRVDRHTAVMDRSDYDAWSNELVERLVADERVVGLVALGSMAATIRQPDQWSDHDFWIVAADGEAAALRDDLGWLPRQEDLALTFAETEHGRSAIYRNGHLVEFAVFDDRELEIARSNVFRVLIDRCRLQERMDAMVELTLAEAARRDPTGDNRFGTLLSQLTIGVTRAARGEQLSANSLVRGRAAQTLAELVASFVEPESSDVALDNLDPNRRFEQAYPSLAAEIEAAVRRPVLDCADALLQLADRELRSAIPAVNETAVSAISATIARARQA